MTGSVLAVGSFWQCGFLYLRGPVAPPIFAMFKNSTLRKFREEAFTPKNFGVALSADFSLHLERFWVLLLVGGPGGAP